MAWLAPEKWSALGQRLNSSPWFATDTEVFGLVDKQSPQHRVRVHCWSVAVPGNRPSPRGYRFASGVVLPAMAMFNPDIRRALENPAVVKYAHNAPFDYHAFRNMGIDIRGMEDTLQWLRVAVPGMQGYGLKGASQWALGKPVRPNFEQVTSYTYIARRSTFKKARRCICGTAGCRQRSTSQWFDPVAGWYKYHEREDYRIETVHEKEAVGHYDVQSFVPGARLLPMTWQGKEVDRMQMWDAYSLEDSVDCAELVTWLHNRPHKFLRSPWTGDG